MTARTARISFDRQVWLEVVYLLTSFPAAVIGFVYAIAMVSVGAGMLVTVVGAPLLALGLAGARLLGRAERARARALLGIRIEEPSALPGPSQGGVLPWLWERLKDPVAWRAVLYEVVRLPWGVLTFSVTLVALLVLWPVLPLLVRGLSNVDRILVRGLLSPSDDLERRIAQLESDRGLVVDTAAADLRRIERDLHDGAQARLVALAMDLGLAKEKLTEDPQAAARMVDEAHGEVKIALQELRDLARGIHPAVLTDRGLDAALSAIATRCTVPVTVDVDLPQRPAPAIEGIAYFTVSELLQNISKHAHAHTATIDVWQVENRLMLQVADDGRGGARLDGAGGTGRSGGAGTEGTGSGGGGTGMAGLAERIGAVDGVLLVDSPVGGPTVVTAELPWRPATEGAHPVR
ncbi:sensor histidine kinase [Streptomyces lichenis]|uniref:histidine kinase n=1 Tax=Streptomyces lichenis TaxID=2306967 RepID=A0ABT0IG14_9ACTN|nr:sensor histidine kinase [Streptomyces lichenis]MCK8680273.1 sensor domain-containing protein [Streptomyces lichenis]